MDILCEDQTIPEEYINLISHLYITVNNFDFIAKGLVTLIDSLWYQGKLIPSLHQLSNTRIHDTIIIIKNRVNLAITRGYFIEQNTRKKRCLTTVKSLGDFINEIESQRRQLIDYVRELATKNAIMTQKDHKELIQYCKELKNCKLPCLKTATKCSAK